MKKIDVESHFSTDALMDALKTNPGYPRFEDAKGIGYFPDSWLPVGQMGAGPGLRDLGDERIRRMDEAGIDYAVLSLVSPGAERLDPVVGTRVAAAANDTLAEAIDRNPDRLGGFAALAPQDIEGAMRELDRCVKDLGFIGWNTHSNFGDSYLDEPRYWPLLARVEELGVPIYLHPTVPDIPALNPFGVVLTGPNLGFGVDVMFAFMRMVVRGVFDVFPNLKIILGHYGEALPFLLSRLDTAHRNSHAKPNQDIGVGSRQPVSYYLKRHVWVAAGGNYLPAAFYCCRDSIGMPRILLGTDYPFEDMSESVDFLEDLDMSAKDRSMLFRENAVSLGLQPPKERPAL